VDMHLKFSSNTANKKTPFCLSLQMCLCNRLGFMRMSITGTIVSDHITSLLNKHFPIKGAFLVINVCWWRAKI